MVLNLVTNQKARLPLTNCAIFLRLIILIARQCV